MSERELRLPPSPQEVEEMKNRIRALEARLGKSQMQECVYWKDGPCDAKFLKAKLVGVRDALEKIRARSSVAGYDSGDSGINKIAEDALAFLSSASTSPRYSDIKHIQGSCVEEYTCARCGEKWIASESLPCPKCQGGSSGGR